MAIRYFYEISDVKNCTVNIGNLAQVSAPPVTLYTERQRSPMHSAHIQIIYTCKKLKTVHYSIKCSNLFRINLRVMINQLLSLDSSHILTCMIHR